MRVTIRWKMKKQFVRYGFLTVVIILIFIFIYPTIYRYDKYEEKIPIRINRITGKTEMFSADGWQEPNDGSKANSSQITFQSDEIDLKQKDLKIGDLEIRKINLSKTDLTAEIINLSKKTITLSSVAANLYDKNGSALIVQPISKLFYSDLKPNETTVFSMKLGAVPYDSVDWDLVSKHNQGDNVTPVEITTYSLYKLNVAYSFK